jgi:hypothetical protein
MGSCGLAHTSRFHTYAGIVRGGGMLCTTTGLRPLLEVCSVPLTVPGDTAHTHLWIAGHDRWLASSWHSHSLARETPCSSPDDVFTHCYNAAVPLRPALVEV